MHTWPPRFGARARNRFGRASWLTETRRLVRGPLRIDARLLIADGLRDLRGGAASEIFVMGTLLSDGPVLTAHGSAEIGIQPKSMVERKATAPGEHERERTGEKHEL